MLSASPMPGSISSALSAAAFALRGKSFRGVRRKECENQIPVGETRVGRGIAWVQVDGLLEILDGRAQPLAGSFIPVVPASQVQVIRSRVLGLTFEQPLPIAATQLEPQLLGNLFGDLFFNREDVGHGPVEPLAPQLRVALHIDELGLNVQRVPALQHLARQQRAYLELAAHFPVIDVLTLVAKGFAARHHAESRHLRKAVNQAFGDAVAQIFGIRIAAGVDERHHRERIDRIRRPGDSRRQRDAIRDPAG